MVPLITVTAFLLPSLVTGSVIVETVFGINGMGKLTVDAIMQRDRELLMNDAKSAEEAGAFGIVLEAIPAELAADITGLPRNTLYEAALTLKKNEN